MTAPDARKTLLGQRIRKLRQDQNLSLRAFGLVCGVHYNQLLRIEHGQANPSFETLCRIADALGVNVHELFETL